MKLQQWSLTVRWMCSVLKVFIVYRDRILYIHLLTYKFIQFIIMHSMKPILNMKSLEVVFIYVSHLHTVPIYTWHIAACLTLLPLQKFYRNNLKYCIKMADIASLWIHVWVYWDILIYYIPFKRHWSALHIWSLYRYIIHTLG